jgi:hypothetical protein
MQAGWQVELHPGNDPVWLETHLANKVEFIQVQGAVTAPSASAHPERSPSNRHLAPTTSAASTPSRSTGPRTFKHLPNGTKCRFRYKGGEFKGEILAGQLVVERHGRFDSFSAASNAVTKTKRNGWKDWNLLFPGSQQWLLADDWRAGK